MNRFITLTNKTSGELVDVNPANVGAISDQQIWIHGIKYRVVETREQMNLKIRELYEKTT